MRQSTSRMALLFSQRGAVLPMVGFIIIALLALAAFAVDIGYVMVTKQQLQNAADACVIGAWRSMTLKEPEKSAEVTSSVIDMAGRHSAGNDQSVYIVPAEDIIIDGNKLTVYARKLRSRNNGLPLFFAKILRMPYADVSAKAAIVVTPTKTGCCVKPWSIPDLWDDDTAINGHENWRHNNRWDSEPFDDVNGNRLYDPGEPFTDENTNGVCDSEYYDRALSQANEAGYIPSLPPDGHIGTQVVLKVGTDNRAAPSFFNPIVLPWPEGSEYEGRGAAAYKDAIVECNPMGVEPGQSLELESEPGRMVGPTVQGTKIIMSQDPDAYWNDAIDNVDHMSGGSVGVSPRIVLVPVFDPRMWPVPGRLTPEKGNSVVVTKIVAFFIENISQDVITARVTQAPVECLGGSEPTEEPSFVWSFQMVE